MIGLVLLSGCGVNDFSADDPPVRSMELRVGESEIAVVTTHCGYEWLEVTVNGKTWMTTDLGSDSAGNPTEPGWPQGQQQAELELTLVDEERLDVTAVGTDISHTYVPTSLPSGCE